MKAINLSSIQRKFKGMWVVLTDNFSKVIAANKDAKVAYQLALKKGYKRPLLFKVPEHNIPYIGFI